MTQATPPKKWKFALLVWLFIYPVITLLSLTLLPLMTNLAAPLRTLIITLILVPLMAYGWIPFINKRFFAWLRK